MAKQNKTTKNEDTSKNHHKDFENFIKQLQNISIDNKTEHTFRLPLQKLLDSLAPSKEYQIIHEPANKSDNLGRPDFNIELNGSVVGLVETKKIGENLDKIINSDQIKKYQQKSGGDNILLTNYIDYIHLLDNRGKKDSQDIIIIAKESLCTLDNIKDIHFKIPQKNTEKITQILINFYDKPPKGIATTKQLAYELGKRTRALKEELNIHLAKTENQEKSKLFGLYGYLKETIYATMSIEEFSDSLAQTISYSLFLAKQNSEDKKANPNDKKESSEGKEEKSKNENKDSENKEEKPKNENKDSENKEEKPKNEEITLKNIDDFIPSNFHLIKEITTFIKELEKPEYLQLKWILNGILYIINHLNMFELNQQLSYTSSTLEAEHTKDPYYYFYEEFLGAYDENLRKQAGVYYTPTPAVNYIVKSLNIILKEKFNLSDGFAQRDKVTVLDFATGTGSFLLSVFQEIFKDISEAKNKDYIKEHILKNIYGFELLMAPYIVAHLKLSQFLKEYLEHTGKDSENKEKDSESKEKDFKFGDGERLHIYLTNTLEKIEDPEKPEEKKQLEIIEKILPAITEEAKKAKEIKEKPILVILGNPPYNANSTNNDEYIMNLLKSYRNVEKKDKKPSVDDYVKFIRFAESKIEKEDHGLIGIITNNGFLDNRTFIPMRKHLLETFDEIYCLNLHGSSRKRETCLDGSKDENIFDIKTGVSITFFIKNKQTTHKNSTSTKEKSTKKEELAKIYSADLYGIRETKLNFLSQHDYKNTPWQEITPQEPGYYFIPKYYSTDLKEEYYENYSIEDIFCSKSGGIKTARGHLSIDINKINLFNRIKDFASLDEETARAKYKLSHKNKPGEDSRDWKVSSAQKDIKSTEITEQNIKKYAYKPFDFRFIYYTTKTQGILQIPKKDFMENLIKIDNYGLTITKQSQHLVSYHVINCLVDLHYINDDYIFPLYLHNSKESNNGELGLEVKEVKEDKEVKENLQPEFRKYINTKYTKYKSPEEIMGYIYGVLYSPCYGTKYQEFLKENFPRIPFVENETLFDEVSIIGQQLIDLHLLKKIPHDSNIKWFGNLDSIIEPHSDKKNKSSSDKKNEPSFNIFDEKNNKIYYNKAKSSGFSGVSKDVYDFKIGTRQILLQYLKDRKGRELSLDEAEHLEKVIKVLKETLILQKTLETLLKDKI